MEFKLLKKIKQRLQFTGWLQYIPVAFISLLNYLAAVVLWAIHFSTAMVAFIIIGSLFFVASVFDLLMIKLDLRPGERLPERNDSLDIFELMRARHSCRSFQSRKLTTPHLNELMEYVRLQSNPPNNTIFNMPALRFEYVFAPLKVWPVVGAREFLVAIAPSRYSRKAVIDVGYTLQKVVMHATRMGLGTCWIGPGADHTSIEQYLGSRYNPEQDHIICVCAVGYESKFKPLFLRFIQLIMHRRLPLPLLFFTDPLLKNPLNMEQYPFTLFGLSFEVCRWSPSSFNSQTTRCAAIPEREATKEMDGLENRMRLIRFDFYAASSSRYYAAVACGIWCANWELCCKELGIHGQFHMVTEEKRKVPDKEDSSQPPHYDVSWVLEDELYLPKT